MSDVEMAQSSLLVEVNVSVTDPAALSWAEGRYCASNLSLDGENVPVPAVLVQIPVVVPPVTLPARGIAVVCTHCI
jgi:hypothetical protein